MFDGNGQNIVILIAVRSTHLVSKLFYQNWNLKKIIFCLSKFFILHDEDPIMNPSQKALIIFAFNIFIYITESILM